MWHDGLQLFSDGGDKELDRMVAGKCNIFLVFIIYMY